MFYRKKNVILKKLLSIPLLGCCQVTVIAVCLGAFFPHAQAAPARSKAARSASDPQHLRSRVYVYDLRDGSSHLVYTTDSIWEAPSWSPDGKYLISNSGGHIYKLVLLPNDTVKPQKLTIPAAYDCNNDKGISPNGEKLAFSATVAPNQDSQVFLADADGRHIKLMTADTPSYFHGWSPDNKTLAFVAQRNGSGQFDIYSEPASGGAEKRLTTNLHHDDGPDYSPDGKWIYINSDRSGKEAIWRFPADGAGPNDAKAEMVVSDSLEDWFPHISPDGSKMVYIAYPSGTPGHDPRTVHIAIKLVAIDHDNVASTQKVLVKGIGGQGTMNVNSWAPDSMRFAYVTYQILP
jgi:Tol biopolymer transport system component